MVIGSHSINPTMAVKGNSHIKLSPPHQRVIWKEGGGDGDGDGGGGGGR